VNSFREDIERIKNLPINVLQSEVTDFMQSTNYKTYAELVYPFDRTVFIYNKNYETLTDFFESIRDFKLFNADATDERNDVLMNAMLHLHNYLSSQYALLQVLDTHANALPIKNQLLSQFRKLRKVKVTDFINALRNNLIHQTNFSNTLRFESEWGRSKIVYAVSELRKSEEWGKATDYISRHTDFISIEDVISEYHAHVIDFLNGFEATLFKGFESTFKDVLKTLFGFAAKYQEIGQQGFLPVSEEYIKVKLKFFDS
jgi:hypothetical protein